MFVLSVNVYTFRMCREKKQQNFIHFEIVLQMLVKEQCIGIGVF
jgi:hypothetical protein